ncbi:MAG: efflux RND transporter periplasmic adaptor subunit [Armatimonadetes bacterium]|nr:efflux RND transporter periplasmic adaptor subunit [Armatimonadota bacterium]
MKRWLGVILPVFLLGSLIVWRLDQKRAENADQGQQRGMKMKGPAVAAMARVEVRDIVSTFDATGSVEAPMSVKIAPKITGRIEMLSVQEGDRVKKGQVLVKIDSSEVEANVQQQMANVAEAQYRLAQAQMNQNPADVAVNTQISQQKANVASAEADYNQTKKSNDAQLAAAVANLSDAQSKIENAKASLRGAQANLANAQTKFDRIEGLYKKGFIAAQDVDDANAALTVQKSSVDIAEGQQNSAIAQKESVQQQMNVVKAKGAADIAASKAKLAQANAALEYAQASTSQKSAYRQSISALKASVTAAQASLRSAQAKRRDTVLISPLDGYVTGRFSDPGAIASPSQPVLDVKFIKQVWVSVPVPEDVCAKLHIGQPAKISFDSLPGRPFDASVLQINPSAETASRQFMVRVILSNKDNLLKPGMFAHVSIETERIKNALVVPREAIQRDKDGAYVMTVGSDNKAKRCPVEPQAEDADFVCIGNALQPGVKVITMSAMPIKEGQIVSAGGGRSSKGTQGGPESRGAQKQ